MKSDLKMALCTGFCGCLTTFSGWNNQQALWLASSVYEHSPYDRLVSLTTWIIDLFCLAGALLFGKDCGKCFLDRKPKPLPLLGSSICIISCGGLCLLIATLIILIFTVPSQRTIFLSPILGIFGAFTRHKLGGFFNGKKGYPIGTFLANISGATFYTIFFVSQKGLENPYEESVGKFLLGALMTGFCSSLTTISSFVNDFIGLPSSKRYIYISITIFLSQLFSCSIVLIAERAF